MCGLFGFISDNGGRPNLACLRAIAVETQSRGRHAFGLAWQDGAHISTFKRSGPASANLGDLERCASAQMIIGHCRYATHGDPADNRNNHPHPADGGWIVHNGVVQNYETLLEYHRLEPRTQCDSEVLGLLIDSTCGRLIDRTANTIGRTIGRLAILGIWRNRMVVARRGNPLWFGQCDEGIYFGSLCGALPGEISEAADDCVSLLKLSKGSFTVESRAIAPITQEN